MHVLHIYKTFTPEGFGGVEQVIRQLSSELRPHGVKTSVLALSDHIAAPTVTQQEGITVHHFPTTIDVASNGISLSAMRHYRALARTADLLHYQFPWPSGDLLHQVAPKSIPSLVSYQSDIVRQRLLKIVYTPLMEIFLRQMDAIVGTTPNYIATSPVLQRFKNKVHCIPNGLNETIYPIPTPDIIETWRAKLPPKFFLFVGALRYYKGLHTLVEAARISGLPVVIAGRGTQEDALKKQTAGLPNVHFLGEVSETDKVALLQLCFAFMFPSHVRSEAFGMSLLEAAMYSKPMISCEIGSGMSYININGETGFTIPPEQPKALADAMVKMCHNPELTTAMGAAARTRFEQLFTAKTMAQSYFKLYQQLLSA